MSDTQKTYLSWLDKLRQREDLLRIFIFTAFTVFCWVGFSIYLSQQRTKIPNDVQKLAVPLNPNIDRASIEEIESRKYFEDDELNTFPIYVYENDLEGKRNLVQLGQEGSTPVASSSTTSEEVPEINEENLEILEAASEEAVIEN